MLMGTLLVVVIHQVGGDVPYGFTSAHIHPVDGIHSVFKLRNHLSIRALPAVSTLAHALCCSVSPGTLPELSIGILAALVLVEHHSCWTTSLLIGHIKHFNRQVSIGLF